MSDMLEPSGENAGFAGLVSKPRAKTLDNVERA
jgi:hypothetical protein